MAATASSGEREPAGLRGWLGYAAAGALLTAIIAGVASVVVSGPDAAGVRLGATIAYLLQLCAFGAMAAVMRGGTVFLAAWMGGMLLRFGGLGAVAFWVTRTDSYPAAPTLLSLAGCLFLLLLVEPIFLREGVRTR